MAIIIIDGVPGSGKTLYAVNHLVRNHYQKIYGIYEQKNQHTVVSNIDGLQIPHEPLDSLISEAGGKDIFFSKDYQEELFNKNGTIIYLIDEAQFLFDRRYYNADVFSWFQYHRHYGQTVYLISQNSKNLPSEIQYCAEYIVRALPRSRSVLNRYFHYTLLSGVDIVGNDKIAGSKEIFALYQSAKADSSEKTRRPFLKIAAINIAFAMMAIFAGIIYFKNQYITNDAVASEQPSQLEDQTYKHHVSVPQQTTSVETTHNGQNLRLQRLNVITTIEKGRHVQKIPYEGVLWETSFFPYQIIVNKGSLYAYLPVIEEEKKEKFY